MKDSEGWVHFDAQGSEHIRPLLDALRVLSLSTPEDDKESARAKPRARRAMEEGCPMWLIATKRELSVVMERLLPPSQRGST